MSPWAWLWVPGLALWTLAYVGLARRWVGWDVWFLAALGGMMLMLAGVTAL